MNIETDVTEKKVTSEVSASISISTGSSQFTKRFYIQVENVETNEIDIKDKLSTKNDVLLFVNGLGPYPEHEYEITGSVIYLKPHSLMNGDEVTVLY